MLRWYYSVDASTILEITDRVRTPGPGGDDALSVGSHAEEGSGWEGSIEVDDEAGDFIPLMHRRIYAVEDSAPAGNQVIGNWFISGLDVVRGTPPVEASRIWQISMADENSLLERRVFVGGTSDRPAETDIARILWALTETELNTLSPDVTYIDQTGPVNLDAADYTLQKPSAIFEHCKKASGKNYWVKYEEAAAVGGAIVSSSVANPTVITTTTAHGLVTGQQVAIAGHSGSTPSINATHTVTVTGASTFTIPVNVTVGGTGGTTSTVGRYVLCYFDAASWDGYPSSISLSNVESEIDDSTVFGISDDTRLNRAGGRSPVSGIVEEYMGGYVYEQDTTVGDTYVYRDVASPSINVKTAAAATAIAERELAELATPDDEVEAEIVVDEAHLNDAMHGMSINLRATHLPPFTEETSAPSYSTGQQMRIMRRQVRQLGPTKFGVRLWMTPMEPTFAYMMSFLIQRGGSAFGADIRPRGTDDSGVTYSDPFTWLGGTYSWTGPGEYPMDVAYLETGPVHTQWVWGSFPGQGLAGTARPTGYHLILSGATGPPVYLGDYPTTPGYLPVTGSTFWSPTLNAPADGIMFCLLAGTQDGDLWTGPYVVTGPSGVVTLRDTMSHDIPFGDPGGDTYPNSILVYKVVTEGETVEFEFSGGARTGWNTIVIFVPGAVTIQEFTHSGSLGGSLPWSW